MLKTTLPLLPRPRDPLFIGRENTLRELHEGFQDKRLLIVHGPGGIGKTAFALEYAYRFSDDYSRVFWLNATTRASLLADYHILAQRLHLPLKEAQAGAPEKDRAAAQAEQHGQGESLPTLTVPDWLASTHQYLLVLDDLHDPALLQQIFPQPLAGHVLITTRDGELTLPYPARRAELPPLDPQSAAHLLLHLAGPTAPGEVPQERAAEALALARELRGQPLALTLAGMGIAATGFSFSRTLLEYRASLDQLPTFQDRPDGFSRELAALSVLSVVSLRKTSSLAANILECCAFLAPVAIPTLLFQLEKGASTAIKQEETWRDLALDLLVERGLLTRNHSKQIVSIHPLLQQAIQHLLSLEEQRQRVTHALHLLFQLIPACQTNTIWRLRILAHIHRCAVLSAPWAFASAEIAKTFAWAASALEQQGMLAEATFLLRKAIAIWERVPGIKPAALLLQRRKLVHLLERQEQYAEAIDVLHQVITACTSIHGGTHPEIILHLVHLARMYHTLQNNNEAEACYQKALTLSKRTRERTDPLVVTTQYELAMLYVRTNEFPDAEFLLQDIHTIFKEKNGADHPETLKRALELAVARMMLHKWDAAETLFQHVSAVYACNPATPASENIRVWHYLALSQVALAHWDAAEATYQRILSCFVESYTYLHPALLSYLMEMLHMYQAQNNPAKQEIRKALMAWVQQIREEQLVHPQETAPSATLEHLNALGGIYLGQGKFVEAEHMFLRSLLYSEQLELRDPVTLAVNLSALAMTQIAQGESRRQQANLFLKAALPIWQHILGVDSSNVAALRASYQQWWEKQRALERHA